MAETTSSEEDFRVLILHNFRLHEEVKVTLKNFKSIINVNYSGPTHVTVELRSRRHSMLFRFRIFSSYPANRPILLWIENMVTKQLLNDDAGLAPIRQHLEDITGVGTLCFANLIEAVNSNFPFESTYLTNRKWVSPILLQLSIEDTEEGRNHRLQDIICRTCSRRLNRNGSTVKMHHHLYCIKCIHDDIENHMSANPSVTNPHDAVPIEVLSKYYIMSHPGTEEFEKAILEFFDDHFVYCSNQSCRQYISKLHRTPQVAECPHCQHRTCTSCRDPAHEGDCATDPELASIMTEQGWKKCPRCGEGVERIEGCSDMECVCGEQFCYICGRRRALCTCSPVA